MTERLAAKYVPVLSFAKNERFFPMAVDDFVGYSTLRSKDTSQPLIGRGRVTPELLASVYQDQRDVFSSQCPPHWPTKT